MKHILIIISFLCFIAHAQAQSSNDGGMLLFDQSGGVQEAHNLPTEYDIYTIVNSPDWVTSLILDDGGDYLYVEADPVSCDFREGKITIECMRTLTGGTEYFNYYYRVAQTANSNLDDPGEIHCSNSNLGSDQYKVTISSVRSAGIVNGNCESLKPSYQWEYSEDGSIWNDVSYGVEKDLTLYYFTETTHYRRRVSYSCNPEESLVTSIVTINKTAVPVPAPQSKYSVTTKVAKVAVPVGEDLDFVQSYGEVVHHDAHLRPVQKINVEGSSNGDDIIHPIYYDEFGRRSIRYLPYSLKGELENAGQYRSQAIHSAGTTEQAAFYNDITRSQLNKTSSFPYSETVYEQSLRNRKLEKGSLGDAYQPGSGNTTTFEYGINEAYEIPRFKYDSEEYFIRNGFWPEGELRYKKITDAEGRMSATYKNSAGQVVLKKSWAVEGGEVTDKHYTYFLYNGLGQLVMEIPNAAINCDVTYSYLESNETIDDYLTSNTFVYSLENDYELSFAPGFEFDPGTSFTLEAGFNLPDPNDVGAEEKEKLITQYMYDEENRLIGKKHPGAGWEYYVYDDIDRLVMMQDGEMRSKRQWVFVKYDKLGRKAYSGLFTTNVGRTREYLANAIIGSDLFEQRNTAINTGYTDDVYPAFTQGDGTSIDMNTVFYDTYDLSSSGNYGISFVDVGGDYASSYSTNIKGLVTATRSRIFNSNQYLTNGIYYDNYYRPIQVHSFTQDINRRVSYIYNFNGQVIRTLTQQRFSGKSTITVEKWYTYYSNGSLRNIRQSVNGQETVTIVSYTYDPFGNVIREDLHNTASLPSALQEVDYLRDIQGNLVSINNIDNLTESGSTPDDIFAMKFGYDEIIPGLTTNDNVRHDGRLTGVVWKNRDEAPGSMLKRSYKYDYDGFGRFKQALYADGEGLDQNSGMYDVNIHGYDKNGNILGITRRGRNGIIDNLTYTYDGNQLKSVSDASSNSIGFTDGASETIEYVYNANGNMLSDDNKEITYVFYNTLNLPTEVSLEGGRDVQYTYAANGTKLHKIAKENGSVLSERYYFEGFEYDGNGDLTQFAHERGRVRAGGSGSYEYDYILTDHLRNTRVMFTDDGTGQPEEVQVNEYYPFGMRFNQNATFQAEENQYTYSGKELQSDFGLNWTDHHARFYDPALGRWHAQDPAYQYHSPYLAMGNNPLSLIDLDGQISRSIKGHLYSSTLKCAGEDGGGSGGDGGDSGDTGGGSGGGEGNTGDTGNSGGNDGANDGGSGNSDTGNNSDSGNNGNDSGGSNDNTGTSNNDQAGNDNSGANSSNSETQYTVDDDGNIYGYLPPVTITAERPSTPQSQTDNASITPDIPEPDLNPIEPIANDFVNGDMSLDAAMDALNRIGGTNAQNEGLRLMKEKLEKERIESSKRIDENNRMFQNTMISIGEFILDITIGNPVLMPFFNPMGTDIYWEQQMRMHEGSVEIL